MFWGNYMKHVWFLFFFDKDICRCWPYPWVECPFLQTFITNSFCQLFLALKRTKRIKQMCSPPFLGVVGIKKWSLFFVCFGTCLALENRHFCQKGVMFIVSAVLLLLFWNCTMAEWLQDGALLELGWVELSWVVISTNFPRSKVSNSQKHQTCKVSICPLACFSFKDIDAKLWNIVLR